MTAQHARGPRGGPGKPRCRPRSPPSGPQPRGTGSPGQSPRAWPAASARWSSLACRELACIHVAHGQLGGVARRGWAAMAMYQGVAGDPL
jgi:hypothetical protein